MKVNRTSGFAFKMSLERTIRFEGNDLRQVGQHSFYGIEPQRSHQCREKLVLADNTIHRFDDESLRLMLRCSVTVAQVIVTHNSLQKMQKMEKMEKMEKIQ